jgi:glycine/D-amino acid oxidase-like deaminating enzyme/nitrite reductase/ring-hydroxylating ferredoxin subunit
VAEPVLPTRPSSLWLDRTVPPPRRRSMTLDHDADVDVAVVGAGITGLVTALLCARTGARVGVFEAGRIGRGATGNTTAKLTVLHQLVFDRIRRTHGSDVAGLYARANQTGLDWIRDYCTGLTGTALPDARFESQPALTFAWDAAGLAELESEVAAARAAGVDARLVHDPDTTFGAAAAVEVPDQAQFDPVPFLHHLAADVESAGGLIWEDTRALGVSDGTREATLHTSGGDVRSRWVVAATGLPFTDRGMFFARCEPTGTYLVAGRVDEALEGMWISSSSPSRSLRSATDVDGTPLVLVGGESHTTGRDIRSAERYRSLAKDAQRWFGAEDFPYRWFTEDYVTADRMPLVGPQWPLPTRVLVATGYSKWGLTNAVAASMVMTSTISGSESPEWAGAFSAARFSRRSVGQLAKLNGEVAARLATGWARAVASTSAPDPAEGQGVVVRRGRHVDARSKLDAEVHTVSAVCTHLGGIVAWNQAEGTWDCPLHGSRFCNDGTMLHGPATNDLPERDGHGQDRDQTE